LNKSNPVTEHDKRAGDRLAHFIALGAGAGRSPFAPGTLGAIEGVLLFLALSWLVSSLGLGSIEKLAFYVPLNIAVFAIGVWAGNRVCAASGLKDPQKIVIDEVSGQLIALTPVILSPSWIGVILAFALFRLFDIFKPYPIRKFEALPGGLGVMADDAAAGIVAGLLVLPGILLQIF
jgi:phosphatidylglycerophosphatase A